MTMEPLFVPLGALFTGAAAALVYACMLWMTIRCVILPRRSSVLAAGSFLLRIIFAAAVLCAGSAEGALAGSCCLFGFFAAHRGAVAAVRTKIS